MKWTKEWEVCTHAGLNKHFQKAHLNHLTEIPFQSIEILAKSWDAYIDPNEYYLKYKADVDS
jgi:hypothetical protein